MAPHRCSRAAALPCAVLLALLAATARCAPGVPTPLPIPDYLGYVALALNATDAAWRDSSCATALGAGVPCNAAAALAATHVAFAAATGAAASLARASHLLQLFLGSWRNATRNGTAPSRDITDFFSCRPLTTAAAGVLGAGSAGGDPAPPPGWTAADVGELLTAAGQVCSACCQAGQYNQPASRASGLALFTRDYPARDADGSRHAYAAGTWADWTANHAYAENANVYNSIFLAETLALGAALSPAALAADLRTPDTRAMLAHFAALVGPAGLAPSYGDSWGGAGGSGAVGDSAAPWAYEELFYWPTVFETAAASAASPELAWAAASYFHAATGGYALAPPRGPPLLPSRDAAPKSLLLLLEAHARRASPPLAPAYFGDAGPAVTVRRLPGLDAATDKLLLYTSRVPCAAAAGVAPYAVLELLSEGTYHAHTLQAGAITHYEAGGVTFLHNAGRDNHLPAAAATAVLFQAANGSSTANFPWAQLEDQALAGSPWRLLELPTANLAAPANGTDATFWTRLMRNLHVAFVNGTVGGDMVLFLGHIALVDVASGAELVLNDFNPADPGSLGWSNGNARASIIADATLPRGAHALMLVCTSRGGAHVTRPASPVSLPAPFDLRRSWTHLRMYWRVEGSALNRTDFLKIGFGPYDAPPGTTPNASATGQNDFEPLGPGPGMATEYPGVWTPGTPYNTLILNPPFRARVAAASAAAGAAPGDTLGVAVLERHYSSGVTWARHVVTLAEGPLLAIDVLTVAPGDRADVERWAGGVSFPLQIAAQPQAVGGAALDAAGFNATGCFQTGADRVDTRLAIVSKAFAMNGGAVRAVPLRVGARRIQLVGEVAPVAAFALPANDAPLGVGTTVFVSALLPHDAVVPAAPLVAAVSAALAPAAGGHRPLLTLAVPVARVGGGAPLVTATLELELVLGGSNASTVWSVTRAPTV